MPKKILIIIAALILLTVLGFTAKKLFFGRETNPLSPLGNQTNGQNNPQFSFSWTEWQDPAGFAFEYPEGMNIDNHPEDEDRYSYLTLASLDRKGRIEIMVTDSPYADIKEWLAKDETAKAGRALETKIASVSGEKVALSDGRMMTAFIDADAVIYLIDAQTENEPYWQPVLTKIIDSFRLIPLKGESQADFNSWLGGFDTESVDQVEPVEVVE